ncbi:hypothetical protein ACIRST_30615 [Kitasatospora sp. NPDC101447]|uniref:hypothetical protein n=1 Tax=Kitasatospora sp. NPDC101447 TaxID=3364102 RepID=UPI0037F28C05
MTSIPCVLPMPSMEPVKRLTAFVKWMDRKERDRRSRADYLHEDEETWTSGTPDSNPDVIE